MFCAVVCALHAFKCNLYGFFIDLRVFVCHRLRLVCSVQLAPRLVVKELPNGHLLFKMARRNMNISPFAFFLPGMYLSYCPTNSPLSAMKCRHLAVSQKVKPCLNPAAWLSLVASDGAGKILSSLWYLVKLQLNYSERNEH